MERPQGDVCVSWQEQRAVWCQSIDGATRGGSDDDSPRDTDQPYVLTAVEVDAGLNGTQNHSGVSAFIYTD